MKRTKANPTGAPAAEAAPGHNEDGGELTTMKVAAGQLRAFIERIENGETDLRNELNAAISKSEASHA